MFIALEKTELFKNKMAYEDEFLNRSSIRWFSKSGRTTSSRTEQQVIKHHGYGDKREGNDFYYLGSARVLNAKNVIQENSDGDETKLVEFTLRLEHEVDLNLYRALTEG